MKDYIKPELEIVTLVTDEAIATDDLSGEMSLSNNPFNN